MAPESIQTEIAAEAQIAARLDRGDVDGATSVALKAYGRDILGYVTKVVGNKVHAEEVFCNFSEDLWKGLHGFRRECSLKTWAYKLAFHAAMRFLSNLHDKRTRRLRTSEASGIEADGWSSVGGPAEQQDHLDKLRQQLSREDQSLLTLRLDRRMKWSEIATVMSVDSAALRKRYERLTLRLRALAREHGLIAT